MEDNIPRPLFPTKQLVEKTGLRLNMTNDTIKALVSRTDVKSSPGKGTIFMIYLKKQGRNDF